VKLNVGAGNVPLIGYTNVDKYYYPRSKRPLLDKALAKTWNKDHPDSPWLYGDMVDLKFPSDYFDEVMLVHVLEHGSMEDGNRAIEQAARVCKPGGKVEIEVPDLRRACERIVNNIEVNTPYWYRTMGLIHGTTGMDGEGQFHLCGYTKEYLRFKMEERGLKDIHEIPVGFGHGNNQQGHPEPEYDFRLIGTK